MKALLKTLVTCAFAVSAGSLFAQAIPNIYSFDENGNASYNGAAVPPGHLLAIDPSGGIAGPVLAYQLPTLVTPGDLALVEAGAGTGATNSDIVRFFNSTANPNQTLLLFYSDFGPGDPPTDLADTGLPFSPNAFQINEVGPEGNNGALWAPVAGTPGFDPSGIITQYNIISDVPEPGTGALFLSGVGVLVWLKRMRSKSRV
jgi:hypothetical protein